MATRLRHLSSSELEEELDLNLEYRFSQEDEDAMADFLMRDLEQQALDETHLELDRARSREETVTCIEHGTSLDPKKGITDPELHYMLFDSTCPFCQWISETNGKIRYWESCERFVNTVCPQDKTKGAIEAPSIV